MAEYDEPGPEGSAAAAGGNGRSPPAKHGDGRSPQHDAQPHRERSSKSSGRGRERDEYDEFRERHRRRGGDRERYPDRETVRYRGDRNRDGDRHHRVHRERSEHRDRSDDRGYSRSRDRDAERGDRDRDGHRRHRSRSRSRSQSKRVSGFDQGPSQAIPTAAPSVIPGPLPFIANPMLPNMTQQVTRHARRVYVGGLSPSANEQTIAVFFNQVMAAIGGNTVGFGDAVVNVYINHDKKFAFVEMRSVEEASNAMALDGIVFDGAPVKVRRPTDYNPSQAAMLGPSQPNPNLNLAAVGLTPGLAGALEGPDRIFVGGLPYYFTEDQVRELLETFGPLRAFDIVKDKETGNSKGYAFCLYKDVSVTDIACAALNGIQLGERTLTVRRANQGSSEPRPEQENILLQAQQQAQMKVMKLAELHKESSEEWSKKAGELEGVIKALETHLTQVEDEYKEKLEKESLSRRDLEKEAVNLKQKLEKCELDLENTRKSSELSLIPLTSIAADSSDLVDTTIREPPISDAVNQNDLMVIPKVPSGVSGTALAASLLRDGWSLAKIYEKYQEATDAFLHEWRGRRHAEAVLERVLHEIEEKAELNLDERAEHERMVEAYALMDQKLRQALLEHDNFENNIRNLKSELKRQESDYSVAQKEIDDLQKQVAVLLKECQDIQIRCGSSLPNVGHGAFSSSLGNVLSNVEHGIKDNMSFKDINGLVQQNVLLRNQVHMLKADLDKKDMELRESFQIELKKITDDAASRVEKVIKKSEEQAIMIESLPRSVAMYRKLCEEQQKARSNVESAPNALQDSSRTDLMVLFEGSQEVSKKAYEQVSERARSLDDELTKLRIELQALRSERDKAVLEADFARDRLNGFAAELEHQRKESNSASLRNAELMRLVVDYERRLREDLDSKQGLEENLRKLLMELSTLKNAKENLEKSEERALDEVHDLTERVHRLQATIDTIHTTEEVQENARSMERRNHEEHIKRLERDWAELKKELQEQRDHVCVLSLDKKNVFDSCMEQVEDMRKELNNSWKAASDAESRAAIAEAKCSDLEAKLKSRKVISRDGGHEISAASEDGLRSSGEQEKIGLLKEKDDALQKYNELNDQSLSRRDLEKEAVNLEQKLEKCERDPENTRKSSELSLIPLTSIAADSSDLVDTTVRELKHDDEELELLLLSWIENSDFCSPIKKVEACLFDFDLLQQFRGDELYYLVELQINKNNNVRRTFGDHKLIYSKVEKEGEVIKKTTYRFQERRGNVNGRKLVEFSKVGGPKDKVLWKIIFGEDKRKMRKAQNKSTQREEKEMLPQNVPTEEKVEKSKLDEKRKLGEQDMVRLMREKENEENTIASLQQDILILILSRMHEQYRESMETEARQMEEHLAMRLKEAEFLLMQSKKKVEEIESASQLQSQLWSRKANIFQSFMDNQKMSIKDIRISSQSIKQEMFALQMKWTDEISNIGMWVLKGLVDAADNYHKVLAENQKLFNEVQELKGNIRVYCRVRPFLPGQDGKTTIIDCIGESGEILITNPFKQGKDACRMFKFNKVFDTHASQAEVFSNIQPLIRSVLDGFNVCIFAYGQTGSGKTYTMTGPGTSKEDRGVNYRALNDLFDISLSRRNAFSYEVGVQMVEIYNEQVRDLLSDDIAQKRLGISSTSQPNGLVVPDASLHPVKSTLDVLEWMEIGETNRAVGSTALNKESSRSHSILTVHVRGVDLKNQSTWRGCLHLIDLAGSERVVQSEASGDRLKEAQYINKSLSALGDVVFALAQRNAHVPYRNSKLTQLLRSSLGGQAKTLMFVQINPDTESYSETISTLKFAERVSGVELGAAISNKEVSYLKDTKSRKDVEIDELLKDKAKSSSSAIDRNDSSQQIRLSGAAGSGEAKCEDNMPDDGYPVAGTVSPVSPVGGASEATEQMQKTASRIATLFLTKNGQPANSKPKPWESALKPPGRTTSTGSQVTGVSSVKPPKWR